MSARRFRWVVTGAGSELREVGQKKVFASVHHYKYARGAEKYRVDVGDEIAFLPDLRSARAYGWYMSVNARASWSTPEIQAGVRKKLRQSDRELARRSMAAVTERAEARRREAAEKQDVVLVLRRPQVLALASILDAYRRCCTLEPTTAQMVIDLKAVADQALDGQSPEEDPDDDEW